MNTVRVNFIIPEDVYHTLKVLIPARSRSKLVTRLLKEEIRRKEKALYQVAVEVENDVALNKEMEDWDETVADGAEDWEWK
ncbi:hypothetical protein ACFL1T_01410 [Chlamydiota bacterium]